MSSRGKGDSRGHESLKLPDGLRPLGKKGPEHKTGGGSSSMMAEKRARINSSGESALTSSKQSIPAQFSLGNITRIQLKDFMCHASLDFSLEPGKPINIITGRNGAGKSSILQALVIGLGGSAKEADRGFASMTNFVRTGCSKAVIKVTICNEPPLEQAYGEAWKLQEFGPRIVFQRDVNKNSANTLQLRSEDGKLLKSGKEATVEGESIRSHFNIALNNPTTVLQQEQAKMFFANHDPEGMYKMIMDGTQIANAIQGYTKASNDAKSTKEKVEKYMKELYAQQAKLDRVMEKQNRDKEENQLNQDRILELHPKVIWGKYQQAKREKKGHEASLGPLDQEITGAMAKLVQAQKKVSDEQKSILGLEDSAAEYQDSIEKVQGELKQLFAQKKREESEWQKAHDVWTQLKREGQILTEQIQDTNNKIHTLKGNQGKEAAKKREDQITNLKAEMGQIDEKHQAHLEALQTGIPKQIEEKRKQESGLKEGRSMLQRDLDQAKYEEKGLLSALNNAGANSMNRLHQNIRRMVTVLEQNRSQFEKAPLGPLAEHVKLTEGYRDKFDILEAALGRPLLESFMVFSKRDKDTLLRICQDAGLKRMPTIYITSAKARYPVKDTSQTGLVLLKDCLHIENDSVFNLLVDVSRIDCVWFAPDDEIVNLFQQKPGLPQHLRFIKSAVSFDFFTYKPYPNFESGWLDKPRGQGLLEVDQSVARRRQEAELAESREIQKTLTEKIELADREVQQCRRDLKQLEDRIQKEDKELSVLQNARREKTRELAKLQSETQSIADLQQKRIELSKKQEKVKSELPTAHKISTDRYNIAQETKKDFEEKEAEVQQLIREKREEVDDEMDHRRRNLGTVKRQEALAQKELAKHQKAKDDLEGRIRACEAKMKNDKKDAEKYNYPEPKEEITQEQLRDYTVEFFTLRNAQNIRAGAKGADNEGLEKGIADLNELIQATEKFKLEHAGIDEMVDQRKTIANNVYNDMAKVIRSNFALNMSDVGLEVKFRMVKSSLTGGNVDITVKNGPLDRLSGGERAKTMVSLIGALWDVQNAPFLCLDEWDVGLDDDARNDVEEMVLKIGTKIRPQLFLINPTKSGVGQRFKQELEDKIKRLEIAKS